MVFPRQSKVLVMYLVFVKRYLKFIWHDTQG